jgi:hypothetical protein
VARAPEPAGWFEDPRERHEWRYWDGSAWTDHVADDGRIGHDPVNAAPPPVAVAAPPPPARPARPAKPPPPAEPSAPDEPAASDAADHGPNPLAIAVALMAGGTALLLSLALPWYQVQLITPGLGELERGVTGFEALSVLDLICLIAGATAVVCGFSIQGRVPVPAEALPRWTPHALAVAAVVALVGAIHRLAVAPVAGGATVPAGAGSAIQVTRGPGVFMAIAAALTVCLAASAVAAAGARFRSA